MSPRERILRAARRIYEKDGLAGLSIRRVSQRVRLTPMALYRHYANKDALLDALVAEGFTHWEVFVQKAADEPTPIARLRGVCEGYVDFALANPRIFELMFLIPRKGVPPAPASLQSTPSPGFSRIIASLHEAMQTGAMTPDDPAQVILFLWGTVHGLVALHFSGRFQFDDAVFRKLASAQIDRAIRLLSRQSPVASRQK
jgi:AcrR family transcriptional regulator